MFSSKDTSTPLVNSVGSNLRMYKEDLLNLLLHDNFFLTPLKDHVFENIMENGVFVHLEQMLHFP